jgi:hypothetical protein
MNTRNPP